MERETVGIAACTNCGEKVTLKKNIKGHLYYNCSWGDGGCGCQFQSRTNDADAHLLRRLKKEEKTGGENVENKPLPTVEAVANKEAKAKSFMDYL